MGAQGCMLSYNPSKYYKLGKLILHTDVVDAQVNVRVLYCAKNYLISQAKTLTAAVVTQVRGVYYMAYLWLAFVFSLGMQY